MAGNGYSMTTGSGSGSGISGTESGSAFGCGSSDTGGSWGSWGVFGCTGITGSSDDTGAPEWFPLPQAASTTDMMEAQNSDLKRKDFI